MLALIGLLLWARLTFATVQNIKAGCERRVLRKKIKCWEVHVTRPYTKEPVELDLTAIGEHRHSEQGFSAGESRLRRIQNRTQLGTTHFAAKQFDFGSSEEEEEKDTERRKSVRRLATYNEGLIHQTSSRMHRRASQFYNDTQGDVGAFGHVGDVQETSMTLLEEEPVYERYPNHYVLDSVL